MDRCKTVSTKESPCKGRFFQPSGGRKRGFTEPAPYDLVGVAEQGYELGGIFTQCPECGSTHIRKNGKKRGQQNHICVDCGHQLIDLYDPLKGYPDEFKRECLKMDVNGSGSASSKRLKLQLRHPKCPQKMSV